MSSWPVREAASRYGRGQLAWERLWTPTWSVVLERSPHRNTVPWASLRHCHHKLTLPPSRAGAEPRVALVRTPHWSPIMPAPTATVSRRAAELQTSQADGVTTASTRWSSIGPAEALKRAAGIHIARLAVMPFTPTGFLI